MTFAMGGVPHAGPQHKNIPSFLPGVSLPYSRHRRELCSLGLCGAYSSARGSWYYKLQVRINV